MCSFILDLSSLWCTTFVVLMGKYALVFQSKLGIASFCLMGIIFSLAWQYCVPGVYNSLQALSGPPVLKATCVAGLGQLYLSQPQSFPLLLGALAPEEADTCFDEVLLAKASVIGDVIRHR